MWLKVYERRGKCYWQLRDRKNRIVARSYEGMRTFEGAKDQARYVMEGLRNCLKVALPVLLLLATVATAEAQAQAHPGSRIGWDQGGTNLAEVNSFGANIYVDQAAGVPVAGKTCSGAASPFDCVANLPAMTPGPHQLRLTATAVISGSTVESPPSAPLDIVMIVIQTPGGLRIVDLFGTSPRVQPWINGQLVDWQWAHQHVALGG